MKIAISAESTIDITKELVEQYDIKIVPFGVFLGDELKYDGEITVDDIIEFVDTNNILPKTSAINEMQYAEHFEEIKKDYDAVIHISLSSELSSACNNAINASKQFENVYVVDSRSLSTGIALLALYAAEYAKTEPDPKIVYEKVCARVPSLQVSFELNRLDYLYKGGRCSGLAYFGANLLKIRPQILVKDGKMISGKKYRGSFDHVVKNYVNDTLETFNTPDLSVVFLTYTTAPQNVLDDVYATLKERGFETIYVTRAGATVTSHCGENCLGILYFNDGATE